MLKTVCQEEYAKSRGIVRQDLSFSNTTLEEGKTTENWIFLVPPSR